MVERKLWTPGGDVTVPDETAAASAPGPAVAPVGGAGSGGGEQRIAIGPDGQPIIGPDGQPLTEEQVMAALLEQVRGVPVEAVIAQLVGDFYVKAGADMSEDGEPGVTLDLAKAIVAKVGDRLGEAGDQLAALRDQAPAEFALQRVGALIEKAQVHLVPVPEELAIARTAIDALAAFAEAGGAELGEATGQLEGIVSQLQLAVVELSKQAVTGDDPSAGADV